MNAITWSLAGVRLAALLTLSAVLAGCASLSADRGFGNVEQVAKARLGKDVLWPQSPAQRDERERRVAELLAEPLTVDAAVQLALLNHRGLQADFEDLGISEAERVQATRLPNPGFSIARLKRGDEVEIERGFHFNLAHLLAMPLVKQAETRRVQQVQGRVALRVLSLAAETRKAYIHAVAAQEGERYARQVQQAAEASAELARRMAEAGNFNKLQQLREHGFYADATQSLARAQRLKASTRERLTRLLGLWGEQTAFKLPERLPDLPAEPGDQPDIERLALAQRMDVQAARLASEQTAKNLGLTRRTRFINVLELGVVRNSSNEAPTQRGVEIGLELPLFDWGTARVARAEAVYMQSLQRAAQTAIDARSEVRDAYGAYRSAWDIARHHRDELVPLRQRISEENLLRYNGMLIGVFELLADARAQIASVNASIEALRDFWLAQADLDMALIGPASVAPMVAPSTATAEAGAAH
jgi:outer membrane protein TolC